MRVWPKKAESEQMGMPVTGRMQPASPPRSEASQAYVMTGPLVIMILVFIAYPTIATFGMAFTSSDGRFAGTRTLELVFGEPRFYENVRITVVYVLATVFGTMVLGFLAAHLITGTSRATQILRPIYLLPWIIPNVAGAIIFRTMLDGANGPVSAAIQTLTGRPFYPLTDYTWSLWVVIVFEIWRMFPFAMLFIAAGLTTIPGAIYEAARLDGAGVPRQLTGITLPLLRPHLFIVTLMVTNAALQSAESIYPLTRGGPGYATETLGVRIFKSAFLYNDVNIGAVLGIVMLVIAVILMAVYLRLIRTRDEVASD